VEKLLAAGQLFHRLYERQKHAEAEASYERLRTLDRELGSPEATRDLLALYRLFKGPIGTTPENRRVAFLPVAGEQPGRNVYPSGTTRDEIGAFLASRPAASDEILHPQTVVRRARAADRDRDLAALDARPELDVLHPGLRSRLAGVMDGDGFYAVPYSLAYGDELGSVSRLLWEAAHAVAAEAPDFAAYLSHRGRDLLVDDYEAGDAAWLRGLPAGLDAQIGAYETYDDELLGVKTFMSLSLMARDRERSAELEAALSGIQAIEDALPYEGRRRVQDDVPVGIFQVIADFGQARGANSATILPNDADVVRKYGRRIMMRHNLLTHPQIFELTRTRFRTAMAPELHDHLTLEGNVQRILWHEIGHYLGVDRCADGRDLDVALGPHASLFEELKADLASMFAATELHRRGVHGDRVLRSIHASGILRVLQTVRPRPEQPYQSMQLMQLNYYLDRGLLHFDEASGRLHVDYGRFPEVTAELLREVLAVQAAGDPRRAAELVGRWSEWRDDLHEVVARRLRDAARYRYVAVRYAAID
jgi:hypothetical protein